MIRSTSNLDAKPGTYFAVKVRTAYSVDKLMDALAATGNRGAKTGSNHTVVMTVEGLRALANLDENESTVSSNGSHIWITGAAHQVAEW